MDYHLAQHAGTFVCDGVDFIADYYEQQKLQTEKYYKQRRLDRLQQRFRSLTENLQSRIDLKFENYIKERTGYNIDLFETLQNRVENIIKQNDIRNPKEYQDVSTMRHFYQQILAEPGKIEILNHLLAEFHKRTITVYTSKEINYFPHRFSEATSPDGKQKLTVEKSGKEENALTYIAINLKSGVSSGFYDVRGHHPNINAFWKDDYNIVVETKKEYLSFRKIRKIESQGEIINIEYIEH